MDRTVLTSNGLENLAVENNKLNTEARKEKALKKLRKKTLIKILYYLKSFMPHVDKEKINALSEKESLELAQKANSYFKRDYLLPVIGSAIACSTIIFIAILLNPSFKDLVAPILLILELAVSVLFIIKHNKFQKIDFNGYKPLQKFKPFLDNVCGEILEGEEDG